MNLKLTIRTTTRFGIPVLLVMMFLSCSPITVPAEPVETPPPATTSVAREPEVFRPPDKSRREDALGADAPRFFSALIPFFRPVPSPGPDDWLANHSEPGQTYEQYLKSRPNRPDGVREKIYILPLGRFDDEDPSLPQLRDYTSRFFARPVELLEPTDPKVTIRTNEMTQSPQWLAGDLLDFLEGRLPDDAYCLLGITMTDLYPADDWNYVFGMAAIKNRVGVYSLARYDPEFFGESRGENWKVQSLERSCKVLAHETCHMFGMLHCVYFDCLMNGSNHLEELDSQNMFLCPVCLRKLHHLSESAPEDRYESLREFMNQAGLESHAEWMTGVLEQTRGR